MREYREARECGILLCGIYVDLNPEQAGEALSPETARDTSLYLRLHAPQATGQCAQPARSVDGQVDTGSKDRA